MANPFYLAMTAAEFSACEEKPRYMAWMACHFSPYGKGLSNCPDWLPEGSLLIVNDRIPPSGHDGGYIAQQLSEMVSSLQPDGVLLDFQRHGDGLTRKIAEKICRALPCPAAVSPIYAQDLPCAVFLPPPPLRTPPVDYFSPWDGRKIWLEVYEKWQTAAVTQDSCTFSEEVPTQIPPLLHFDEALHCRYAVSPADDKALFYLHRGQEDLLALPCPIEKFVGLYQEFGE